jgi:hypothetical protein
MPQKLYVTPVQKLAFDSAVESLKRHFPEMIVLCSPAAGEVTEALLSISTHSEMNYYIMCEALVKQGGQHVSNKARAN